MRFDYFIREERAEIKHLEHLEDLFLQRGFNALHVIKDFLSIYSNHVSKNAKVIAQIKIDGSPAVVIGKDPRDHKFFISTKSAFAGTQKLAKSLEDIRYYFSGELAKKMSIVFNYLSGLNLSSGEGYQMDLVFTNDDKKSQVIDGENYISFRANVINYAVKEGSQFFNRVQAAQIGLVVHTKYKLTEKNNRLEFSQQHLNFSKLISQASHNPNIFLIDNIIKSDKIAKSQLKNKNFIFKIIKEIESRTRTANDFIQIMQKEVPELSRTFMAYINNEIFKTDSSIHADAKNKQIFRGEHYYSRLIDYINETSKCQINKYKTIVKKAKLRLECEKKENFLKKHKKDFIDTIRIYYRAITVKYLILEDLKDISNIFSKSFIGSTESDEGIVLVSAKNVVKVVDRLEFSKQNRLNWEASH